MADPIPEQGCVFCRIIRGDEPATIVRRWGDAMAIMPLNPVVEGHVLVIPVAHVADATQDPYLAAQTMRRAAEIATPPCNLITSAGAEATQTVRHLHIHVVPRRAGDGLALPWTRARSVVANSIHITGPSPNDLRTSGFIAGLQQGYEEGRRHHGR